jgi:hypothetical protein
MARIERAFIDLSWRSNAKVRDIRESAMPTPHFGITRMPSMRATN